MKIVDVRIHQVIVPMRPGVVHSEGVEDKLCAPDPVTGRSLNFWEFPKWIIELEADNGLIGLGEPRRGDLYGPLREHADLIIGKELIDLPIGNLPLPHTDDYDSYFIYEAYEMAWFDLLGKHLGVPVHHLLGGKKIDRVPVDFWMGRGTPADTAARAQTGLDLGFRGMKMKCMLGDPIAERVAAGCEQPCDIIGSLLREDDLIVDPIPFEDGLLVVPDAPGLGVELDRDALAHYGVPVGRGPIEGATA